MFHVNAALRPWHHLTVARLTFDDGWPTGAATARIFSYQNRRVDNEMMRQPRSDVA